MTGPHNPASAGHGDAPRYDEFVRLFVAHETRLRGFLRSLMPAWAEVDEVMQETSLVAWRKFDRFERGSNFMAWVATIARYEAVDYLRRRGRESFLFSDVVIEALAAETESAGDNLERERHALERCLEKLGQKERDLLLLAYRPGARFKDIAAQAGKSIPGYYKSVQRLRARLLACIETELKKDPP